MSERLLQDIETLIGLFDKGGWQELRVSSDGLSLLISRDLDSSLEGERAATIPAPRAAPPPVLPAAEAPARREIGGAIDPAWHAVAAPNLGTFYRSPKPGADAFVELGQRVSEDSEVCLLEVMKLFTSVKAGQAGTITRICVADAELVEGGQVLFYIQTD